MSWRSVSITCVSLWLALSVARQTFDLIGRLWIPVVVNLLQILCCIMGLFAICQSRSSLLTFFTGSCVLSIAYNAVIFCWYLGYLGDATRPILSAGLPYSFSFFLKHTPWCAAHFDLQKNRWVQGVCSTPYFQIEAAQAVLHIILSTIAFVTSIGVFCTRGKQKVRRPHSIPVDHLSNLDKFDEKHRRMAIRAPSSINEQGVGYMNSVYDEASEIEVNSRPNNDGRLHYDRNAKRKMKNRTKTTMPHPDDFSSNERAIDSGSSTYAETSAIGCRRENGENGETQGSQNGRFRKGKEKRGMAVDDATNFSSLVERDGSTGNLQKLISFDPKSNDTLIRVRERIDSDSDDERLNRETKYSIVKKSRERNFERSCEDSEGGRGYGTYEKISSYRKETSDASDQASPTLRPDHLPKSPDASGSSDSGIPSSSCDTWSHPEKEKQKFDRINEIKENEIQMNSKQQVGQLMEATAFVADPSRDTWSELVRKDNARKESSGFQVRSIEVPTSIERFYSPLEMRLVSDDSDGLVGELPTSAGISLIGSPLEEMSRTNDYDANPSTSYARDHECENPPIQETSYMKSYNSGRVAEGTFPNMSTSDNFGVSLSRELNRNSNHNPAPANYGLGLNYRFSPSDVGIPLNSNKDSFMQRLQETRRSSNLLGNLAPTQGLRSQLRFTDSSPGIPLEPDSRQQTIRDNRPIINDNSLLV